MTFNQAFIDHLRQMAHSPLRNYAVTGLTSYLIGAAETGKGCVRLFASSRLHQDQITPHSHRFDFHCIVLRGDVENIVWVEAELDDGDHFRCSKLTYGGEPGNYTIEVDRLDYWRPIHHRYSAGGQYSMKADEIHSIRFGRDAVVLFFEGPTLSDSSFILEPWVDGQAIETLKREPWMFQREKPVA